MTTKQVSPRPEIAVRAVGVGRRFGRQQVLDGLTFDLPTGAVLLVAGANGSGKSTLLRLILGLDRPDRGELLIFGEQLRSGRERGRSRVGALLHEDAVYPRLTVRESVDLWRGVVGSRRPTAELLAAVGLEAASDRPVTALSAGMRKRLALTRTLMIEPQLVVWDEPLASLDAAGRALIVGLVEKLRRATATVVVASHEREMFASVADHVLDLDTANGSGGLQKGRR